MRYFKLINGTGETLDITTQEYFFHEIKGLGFDTENSFRISGDVWLLSSSRYTQQPVSGKMSFTDIGNTGPYEKYFLFSRFIEKRPLTLLYNPEGLSRREYRRTVMVKELAKSELNNCGILEEEISFLPLTPWYRSFSDSNDTGEGEDETTGWIWGKEENGVYVTPPLVFEPTDGQNATRAKFRAEPRLYTIVRSDSSNEGPVKLIIHGPAVNPLWTHYVNGTAVETGGFDGEFSLSESETLTIDNTTGEYIMTVLDSSTGITRNVYSLRDFDKLCFFSLQEGTNTFTVTTSNGARVKFDVEGRVYYATV